MLPQGSRIRLVCGEGSDDANFAAVASETGVAIERYKPPVSIPQHDRFLRLRERLWSVGSSLNHLGYNFSAIIDVRDPVTFGEIASVMDACISGIPEATS